MCVSVSDLSRLMTGNFTLRLILFQVASTIRKLLNICSPDWTCESLTGSPLVCGGVEAEEALRHDP